MGNPTTRGGHKSRTPPRVGLIFLGKPITKHGQNILNRGIWKIGKGWALFLGLLPKRIRTKQNPTVKKTNEPLLLRHYPKPSSNHPNTAHTTTPPPPSSVKPVRRSSIKPGVHCSSSPSLPQERDPKQNPTDHHVRQPPASPPRRHCSPAPRPAATTH